MMKRPTPISWPRTTGQTTSLLAVALLAASTTAADPPSFEEIDKAFAAEVARLQKPVTARYLTALDSLLEKFTEQGDSDAAAAVSGEMERARSLLADPPASLFPVPTPPPDTRGLFEVPGDGADAPSTPPAPNPR